MVLHRVLPAFALWLSASAAFAQSNEVFLGQVGDQNEAVIDQTGARNIVGGSSNDLRLNQLGAGNTLTITQVGEDNAVGPSNLIGVPGFLTGTVGSASGLTQAGDVNQLIVEQRSGRDMGGGSTIGAIDQRADSAGTSITNSAEIRQIGGRYDPATSRLGESSGPANHLFQELAQQWLPTASTTGTNRLEVDQLGFGQSIWQIRQSGAQNSLSVLQSVRGNALRIASQDGAANQATLISTGEDNTIGNLQQTGQGHALDLSLVGDRNFVDQVRQTGFTTSGGGDNLAGISIFGDDNGGEGIGGYRAMSAQGSQLAGYAASVEQVGDGNQLQLTIGASSTGGGSDGNLFSLSQSGLQNGLFVTMTGDGNETNARQTGDGNTATIVQDSDAVFSRQSGIRLGNIASLSFEGDANDLLINQSGLSNRADVTIVGSRNDVGASIPGRDDRDALLQSLLAQGGIVQAGRDNTASVSIVGNENLSGIFQAGTSHSAMITTVGDGNQAGIGQIGEGQLARVRQGGEGNSASIGQY
ncbi:hypothetical protein DYI37_01825 [Fulvimarina endophytica]|uniref:Curlin n=1 Tax=Fulvimarina endophytica TaxID=2293836 RepID=A0A371XAH0_9HYPH|nr:hypothetical protein [Fulvimarina endophytica]RFC66225.1 hypothetical protein DYI37_01825 [Fulvimarina endophytica]